MKRTPRASDPTKIGQVLWVLRRWRHNWPDRWWRPRHLGLVGIAAGSASLRRLWARGLLERRSAFGSVHYEYRALTSEDTSEDREPKWLP